MNIVLVLHSIVLSLAELLSIQFNFNILCYCICLLYTSIYPDVLMMDGGRGQVNIALEVLDELGLNIPVLSLIHIFSMPLPCIPFHV